MTVCELVEKMPASEFVHWIAYLDLIKPRDN